MIRDISDYEIGFIGEYNPDEGDTIPFCTMCGDVECTCPPEDESEEKP